MWTRGFKLLRFYSTSSKLLSLENFDSKISILTLTNPAKRNPISHDLLIEINDIFNHLQVSFEKDHHHPQVLIIKSTGPVFSAGHDLKELLNYNKMQRIQLFDLCSVVLKKIRKLPQPVIAQVNGLATAAGLQFVSSCDLAICSSKSTFSAPGIKVGLCCTTPGIELYRSTHSPKKTLEMMLTGEAITAQEALKFGIVNKVVEKEEDLEAETLKLAQTISQYSAEVIHLGKHAFYEQIQMDLDAAYQFGEKKMVENLEKEDCKEGIKAFFEKRKPVWKDKN